MGKCIRCQRFVPGDMIGAVCSACQAQINAEKAKNMPKRYYGPIRFYCSGCGKLMREDANGSAVILPNQTKDGDGFYHIYDSMCGKCAKKTAKHMGKVLKRLVKILLLLAIIGGIIYFGGNMLNRAVLGKSDLSEKGFYKKLSAVEENPGLIKNVDDGKPTGETIVGFILDAIEKDDYHMYYYTETGKIEVQKRTSAGKSAFYWKFDKDYGKFGDKLYVLDGDTLLESGDEKIAYMSTAAKYDELTAALNAYLPENICAKETFTAQNTLSDDKYMIDVLISDDSTVYIDWNEGEYFEKSPDVFIRMTFSEQGKGYVTMSAPKTADFTVVE